MALINCPECATQVSDKANACPKCGCPIKQSQADTGQSRRLEHEQPQVLQLTKSRGTYIILGILLGYAGFHNFYSGHYVSGAIKLLILSIAFFLDAAIGFRTGFSLVAAAIFSIWALIELVLTRADAKGVLMT